MTFPLSNVADRVPTSDRYLRAMLRGATAAGVITGWQGPHRERRDYVIAPACADAESYPLDYVIAYCKGLAASGIEPLYRASEPEWLYG